MIKKTNLKKKIEMGSDKKIEIEEGRKGVGHMDREVDRKGGRSLVSKTSVMLLAWKDD